MTSTDVRLWTCFHEGFPRDRQAGRSVTTTLVAGIEVIVQLGGSLRNQDSIKAANELGIVMVFTDIRHFLH